MNIINQLFTPLNKRRVPLLSRGIHHYQIENDHNHSRIHLRVDEDGSGLLIINSNRIFHLNPSALEMAFLTLEEIPQGEALKLLSQKFAISRNLLANDLKAFQTNLSELINDSACPICDLELETATPFSSRPSAPYRMDLALTYRCNNACAHCYNARSRAYPELSTSDWKLILDKLWEIGIPHIVFTGGEPTLREDLPELIAYAENLGQITGLNTNGRRLNDVGYVGQLISAGLDHVQITLESHDPDIHDLMVCHKGAWKETVAGLRNVLKTRLFVMTNTTMLTHNQSSIPETINFLAEIGVPTVGLNALIYSGKGKTVGTGLTEESLSPLLQTAQKLTTNNSQRLIWYTPTQYCNFDPTISGLGVKGCTAALYNMCIEPEGTIIPCQSYYQPVGNILKDEWNSIWNHDLCVTLRERKYLPEKCVGCLIVQECGGGCPLLYLKD